MYHETGVENQGSLNRIGSVPRPPPEPGIPRMLCYPGPFTRGIPPWRHNERAETHNRRFHRDGPGAKAAAIYVRLRGKKCLRFWKRYLTTSYITERGAESKHRSTSDRQKKKIVSSPERSPVALIPTRLSRGKHVRHLPPKVPGVEEKNQPLPPDQRARLLRKIPRCLQRGDHGDD